MSKAKKSGTTSSRGTVRTLHPKNHDRIWLVVADACHARILEGDRDHSGVALVLETAAPRMSGASRTRAHSMRRGGDSPERHVVAPLKTLKTHEMQIFFSRLADYLGGNAARYDSLVLVAPNRVLTQLKRSFPKALLDKVIDRHGEDLTWMSAGEILDHLGTLGKEMRRLRRPANPLPFLKRRKSA
jgi:protein required for attachment to host cells